MFVQVFPCRCTEKLKQTFWPTQSYGFSSSHVWMCELDHKEAWALKNWCFWIVVLEKTLVSWTARSHQSNLKEINPVHSLEGLMLKLKLQYFGHLMQGADSLEKTLMPGKIEGRRRRGWYRMTWLDGISESMDLNLRRTEEPDALQAMWSQRVRHDFRDWTAATLLNNVNLYKCLSFILELWEVYLQGQLPEVELLFKGRHKGSPVSCWQIPLPWSSGLWISSAQ